ncbi:MAG TPA: AraC family transcriptional regulator [Nitrosospira sp.]|nr:AraC family transcriptional regulator [Nitrosospira sp.]
MINVTHRSSDSEEWNVKYILLRLPQAKKITSSSCPALGGAAISNRVHHDYPSNKGWVFGNPQCPMFAELQIEVATGTLLAFLIEPVTQANCLPLNNSVDRRYGVDRRRGERRRNILASIKEFIDKSLALESLDAALIGHRFGMSRSSVYRMFESEGGVANYIRRRRLMQALSLLALSPARGRPRILDIAIKCGFSSDMVFTRAFRKMFSMSPSMVHSMTELQSLKLDTLLKALNTDVVTQPVVFAAADRPVVKL